MKHKLLFSGLMLFCMNTQATIISNLEDYTNGGSFFAKVIVQNGSADTVTIRAT